MRRIVPVLSAVLLLSACATTPQGPTVQVLPTPGKSFAVFQQEDAFCKSQAAINVANAAQPANNR
jgi:starvation-inducible outer membrane lipoprotein